MNQTDILLINCPITFEYHLKVLGDQGYWPPLGLLYLAAVLEKEGIRVKIIDPAISEMSLDEVMMIIDAKKPSIIGFSALTSSIRTCVQLAEAIRSIYGKDIKLCLGGSHISADPGFFIRFPLFDVAVTGEAEQTFCDIVLRLLNQEDVKGIFPGAVIKDLDTIPFPSRHLVNLSDYACHKNREIGLITSRGCPFHCSFCSRPAVSNHYRMRSSKTIVDEMEIYYQMGRKRFYFLDDILTLNKNHIMALCDEIIRRGLKISWGSNTRADCMDAELITRMAEAGCSALLYGVESGNPRIRNDVIGKGVSDEDIFEAIRLSNEKNIVSGIFLMMGFPTETDKELKDTIHYSRKADPSITGVHLTKPMPGAKIFNQAIEQGVIEKDVIDQYARGDLGEGFVENWPIYIPPGMNRKQLNAAKRKAIFLFYLRPKWILKNAKRYLLNWKLLWFDFKKAVSIAIRGQSKESMS